MRHLENVSTHFENVSTHLVNVWKFNHPNKSLVSECLKSGFLTECSGNVHIATLHIVPFLMGKLPTANTKAALSDGSKVTV